MLKTKRHLPQFESLEAKVLLSTGMANPAKTKRHDRFRYQLTVHDRQESVIYRLLHRETKFQGNARVPRQSNA